jgi:hypothetical protein
MVERKDIPEEKLQRALLDLPGMMIKVTGPGINSITEKGRPSRNNTFL